MKVLAYSFEVHDLRRGKDERLVRNLPVAAVEQDSTKDMPH